MDFTYRLDAEGGDTEADTGNEHKARRNAFKNTLIHYLIFDFKKPAPAGAREGKNTMIFAKPGIPSDSILLKAEASRR